MTEETKVRCKAAVASPAGWKVSKPEQKANPQIIALQSAVNGLQNAINQLTIVTVNFQTAHPQIFDGTCKAIKETIGDLTVTRTLAASRLPKEENG